MADIKNGQSLTPEIVDKRVNPPGILPKNIQTWVLAGIAVVMVLVIALSGRSGTPKESPRSEPVQAAADASAARIQEYQQRIEEQTRKLQIEQEDLGRTKEAQSAEPRAIPYTPYVVAHRPEPEIYREAPVFVPDPRPQDAFLEAERAKREYQSLFASNVALSYRKEVPLSSAPSGLPSLDDLAKLQAFDAALAAVSRDGIGAGLRIPAQTALGQNLNRPLEKPADPIGSQAVAIPQGQTEQNAPRETPSAVRPQVGSNQGTLDDAPGSYRVFEGTVLETVLTNRLDGSFSGPVNCMVTTNVYSRDGMHVVVPQGSRILGEARKVETFGQQRLAVFFHRMLMPDGYSVSLDQFQGLNQIGETGLRDKVNHHYLQVFGVSLAIGAIAGLGQAGTGSDSPALNTYEQGVAASLSQSSLRILDRYLNVLPTFIIREGHRVKIYLSQDLLLPAYDKRPK